MLVRLIAALVGIAIVIPTLLFGGVLGVQILVGFIVVVGMNEFVTIALGEKASMLARGWMILLGLFVWSGFVFL